MQEQWEIEYKNFQSVVVTICEYAKKDDYSLPEINRLSLMLILAHRKIGDAMFSPPEGTQNNYPDNFFDVATNAYTAAYQMLNLLREKI
jgi:hypothetical protein